MDRILIVDDDDHVSRLIALTLSLDFQCERARNAAEALDLMQGADLMTLDFKLPDMPGPELFNRARERGYAGTVLFLTAMDSHDRDVESLKLELGDESVLLKPFDPDALLDRVNLLLGRTKVGPA